MKNIMVIVYLLLYVMIREVLCVLECKSTHDVLRESGKPACNVVADSLREKALRSSTAAAEFEKMVYHRPISGEYFESTLYVVIWLL